VSDRLEQVDELSALMEEFGLSEASLTSDGFTIRFSRRARSAQMGPVAGESFVEDSFEPLAAVPIAPAAPTGTPVTSPMNGIFYRSANPATPAYVKEGDVIEAGDVIGLVEAMKVFNEVPSPIAGTVLRIIPQTGEIVHPGDVILYVA